MRGIEPDELIGENGITKHDIAPYIYPSDDEIERIEVRGVYISNFVNWDAENHARLMMEQWEFSPVSYKKDRTFNLYGKIEDHANDVHDYLKYLKFGYGRATDDTSMEIRHGRMTREQGKSLVKEYDSREPTTLKYYCDFLGISRDEFYGLVEGMRDKDMWEKVGGKWQVKDAVWMQDDQGDDKVAAARVEPAAAEKLTFSTDNSNMYFNESNHPEKKGEVALDQFPKKFEWI